MVDSDLARLYRVETKHLNRAVKRNAERFPHDFMFQLTVPEASVLRRQIGTSNGSRGGPRYRPYVFTEHGVAMLASVLKSNRAAQMNIIIVRAFVRLRELLSTHKALAQKFRDLERRQTRQGRKIDAIYSVVEALISPKDQPSRRYGFPAAVVEVTRPRLALPASRRLTAPRG